MAEVKFQVSQQGLADLLSQYDQLGKAEQKLVRSAVAGDEKRRRSHSRSAGSAKSMGRQVLTIASAFGVATSSAEIFSRVVESARKHMERLNALRSGGAQTQMDFGGAMGQLLTNDPSLAGDPAKMKRFRSFALREGAMLGEGGAAQTASALASVRSGTFGMATDDERMGAMTKAITAKTVDPTVELAEFAEAILRTRKAIEKEGIDKRLGIDSMALAETFVMQTGAQFAGNAAEAFKQLPKVLAAQGAGADPGAAVGAWAAFTGATGDKEGRKSSTSLLALLSSIQSGDMKIGGQAVKFQQGRDPVMKLLDIITRINVGEFGTTQEAKAAAFKDITTGAGGVEALKAIQNLNPQQLKAGIDTMQKAVETGAGAVEQIVDAMTIADPSYRSRTRTSEAAGRAEEGAAVDLVTAEFARGKQRGQSLADLMGDNDAMDPTRGLQWLSRVGRSPEEKERLRARQILARFAARETAATSGALEVDDATGATMDTGLADLLQQFDEGFAAGGQSEGFRRFAKGYVAQNRLDTSNGISRGERAVLSAASGQSQAEVFNVESTPALLRELIDEVKNLHDTQKDERDTVKDAANKNPDTNAGLGE